MPLSESRLANLGARAIHAGFDAYHARFRAITRRARARFEGRDWRGLRLDATDRLDLYRQHLDPLVAEVHELLGEREEERLIWAAMKAVYSGLIADRSDWELAETFFNSVQNGQPLFALPNPFPAGSGSIPSQSISGFPADTENVEI